MSAAQVLTFVELNFGMTLRDRIAIVIDELYFYISQTVMDEMTAVSDRIAMALTVSDQVTNIFSSNLEDRRILYQTQVARADFGTAASAAHIISPLKQSFSPPMIALPNRIFFGIDTSGLASAGNCVMRMHFRTVRITQDQQLIEVLESFQLST